MHKLLIVDDSSIMRQIVVRLLERAGLDVHEIFEASSGVEALELLAQHPDVGLVLSEVDLPDMAGGGLVRELRKNRDRHDLPVLMAGTLDAEELVSEALDDGANGYLPKPFTPKGIRAALDPYWND